MSALYNAIKDCNLAEIKSQIAKLDGRFQAYYTTDYDDFSRDHEYSPLQVLIESKHPQKQSYAIIEYLLVHHRDEIELEQTADYHRGNKCYRITALLYAVRHGRLDVVKLLLQYGALVTAKTTPNRWSILHIAGQSTKPLEMGQFLLDNHKDQLDINYMS